MTRGERFLFRGSREQLLNKFASKSKDNHYFYKDGMPHTAQWASARGRQVEIESGNSFRMLPDHINQQWLAEICPGAPLPIDVAIRGKLIEHRIRKS
jgi:hypothetical protein